VVRRIFALYGRGEGFRSIAHALNADGVEPPRPRKNHAKRPSWALSSIRSMVLNPIYKGEYIWNRSEWIKDHETGKRRRFERPESEWVRQPDPRLAIVDAEVWERAQAVMRSKSGAYKRDAGGRIVSKDASAVHRTRSIHLLSGLLECGVCGGSFYVLNGSYGYGCG